MLHYRAVARTTIARTLDILMCIVGMIAMIYTTSLTIQSWGEVGKPKAPGYCDGR